MCHWLNLLSSSWSMWLCNLPCNYFGECGPVDKQQILSSFLPHIQCCINQSLWITPFYVNFDAHKMMWIIYLKSLERGMNHSSSGHFKVVSMGNVTFIYHPAYGQWISPSKWICVTEHWVTATIKWLTAVNKINVSANTDVLHKQSVLWCKN